MASREVRRLVYGRLPLWGSIQRDGPLASPHSNHGGSFGPRLCVPTWCTDLTCAFAALNPQTTGLAARGDTAWLVHAPFNDMQRVVWAYYVDGAATPLDLRRADKQQWAHDRDREIAKEQKARDWRVDDEIALRLHLSGRTARRLRTGAVWLMATLVNWEEDLAA